MLEKLPDAVGHALRNQRAGLDKLAFNLSGLRTGMAAIEVSSIAFADHAPSLRAIQPTARACRHPCNGTACPRQLRPSC
jgi:hypothetical protein